ncbi:MAG: hypothetical protein V4657_13470 [Pseudomonadota bacterium]
MTATNEIAAIGDNGGPPLDPFAAHETHILDLMELAESALHGNAIETPEQAAAVDEILSDIKKAAAALEATRKAENRPFDDGKAAVQAIAKPLASKLDIAKDTAIKALTPWRNKVQADKDAEQVALRAEADRLADEARTKFTHSAPTDLAARIEAEEMAKIAKAATVAANKIDRSATGLRTRYEAEIIDPIAFGKWAWEHRRPEYMKFLETLAASEARANVNIDGLKINIIKLAA